MLTMTAPSATPSRKRPPRTLVKTPASAPVPVSPVRAANGGGWLSDREIVRAAREIIAEVGVEGLSMRRHSANLGVALGATYHHVPTKHDLLLLVGQDLYSEVTSPMPGGRWDARVKALMVNVSSLMHRYPGMAGFITANVDELTPIELNRIVRGILSEAGFSERGMVVVMSALFFYVNGATAGGFADPTAKVYQKHNMQALFEDGLDVLLAGAQRRLDEDLKRKRARVAR
jgi:AcrR family transcriptional regulator